MTVYLAPTSNGLGSLISNLAAIDALVKRGDAPVLVLRSNAQKVLVDSIVGLKGSVMESDFAIELLDARAGDVFINLRDHPLQTDHVWGSDEFAAAFPDTYFEDVLETICRDKGIDIKINVNENDLTPLKHSHCAATAGKVVFVPGSNGSQKCWPASHFVHLAATLQKRGLDCLVVGEPEKSEFVKDCLDAGLIWHATPDFGAAIDAVSSALAVVSVDTGLLHVAVHQNIPTVGLFRKSNLFLKSRTHTRYLQAPQCAPECLKAQDGFANNRAIAFDSSAGFKPEQFYWLRWQCGEEPENRCMARISPGEVASVLDDLLAI